MTPLRILFELYRMMLEKGTDTDVQPEGEVSAELLSRVEEAVSKVQSEGYEELDELTEGDVLELVPSIDGLEFLILVYRVQGDEVEVMPLSRFTEFATPSDVLVEFREEWYMAQTDLRYRISKGALFSFPSGEFFRVGRVDLSPVRDVVEGKKKGAGGMSGGVKREFKRTEARRYFALFAYSVAQEEFVSSVEEFISHHRELPLAAAEQEQTWGEKERLSWTYNVDREKLVILPSQEVVGKRVRVRIRVGEDEISLFEGTAPERLEIPFPKAGYSYTILEGGLDLEVAE